MSLIEAVKERALGQWALAYLGGAWLLLEVSAYLGDSFDWPGWVNRVLRDVEIVIKKRPRSRSRARTTVAPA